MAARCGIPPCVHGEDLAQGSDKAIVPGTKGVTEWGRMFEDSTLVAALVGCLMRQATSRGVYLGLRQGAHRFLQLARGARR
jgi:hypothetical protein